MIKVLKTDLFRLFRSKVFYVFPFFVAFILLVGAVLTVDTVTVESEDNRGGKTVAEVYSEENSQNAQQKAGTEAVQTENITVKISMPGLFDFFSNGTIMLFVGIVLVIFGTCETRMGFVKNAVGSVRDRGYMPLSKIVIGILVTVIYLIEYAVIYLGIQLLYAAIGGKEIEYQALPDGDSSKFIEYLMICFLIHIAFVVIITMLHELTYSRAFGIVFTVAFAAGLLERAADGFVYLMQHFFDIWRDFKIDKYMLMLNIQDGYASESFHPQIMIILSIIYAAVFGILALFISRRKEIK